LIAIKDFLLTGSRKLSAVIGESNYAWKFLYYLKFDCH
jgi:hypothetical protein